MRNWAWNLKKPEVDNPQACIEFNTSLAEAKRLMPELNAKLAEVREAARVVTPEEIVLALEVLESRYHRFDKDYDTAKVHTHEDISDLAHITVLQLKTACEAWRLSPEKFSPRSAGQLLPLIGPDGGGAVKYVESAISNIMRLEELPVLTPEQIIQRNADAEIKRAQDAYARQQAEAERAANIYKAKISELEGQIASLEICVKDQAGTPVEKVFEKRLTVAMGKLAALLADGDAA